MNGLERKEKKERRENPMSIMFRIFKKYNTIDKYRILESCRRIYVHYCPKCRIVIAFTHRPIDKKEKITGLGVPRRCPFCGSDIIINEVVSPRVKLIRTVISELENIIDRLYEIDSRLHRECEAYMGDIREVIDHVKKLIHVLEERLKA